MAFRPPTSLSLLLLIVVLSAASGANWTDDLQDGIDLLRQKRFTEALLALDRAKSNSEDARPYFYSGLALMESGQPDRAAIEFERAIELDPEQAEYALAFGDLLVRRGRKLSAATTLAVFSDEARLNQLSAQERLLLTDLLVRIDQLDMALKSLDAYAVLQPGDSRLPLQRAEILLRKGDFPASEEAYRAALSGGAPPAPSHYGLGMTLWQQGKLVEAYSELSTARNLEPQRIEYGYQLGMLLIETGEAELALAELQRIEGLGANGPPVYTALARAARASGEPDLSRTYLEKLRAVQAARYEETAFRQQVDVLVSQAAEKLNEGSNADAERLLLEAVRIDPDSWVAQKYLTQIYLRGGRLAAARPHLDALKEIQPGSFDRHFLWADYWHQENRLPLAREEAENAKRLSPGSAELRNLLGNIYLAMGLEREALAEYQAASSLSPDRVEFRLNYEALRKRLQESPN